MTKLTLTQNMSVIYIIIIITNFALKEKSQSTVIVG